MEERFCRCQYYIPEFYNKILKNNKINTKFASSPWQTKTRVSFLNYIKNGFPTKPLLLTKESDTDSYLVIDGYNRIMAINDFVLGALGDNVSVEDADSINISTIDVYIANKPLQDTEITMLRSYFHGSCELKDTSETKIITQEKTVIIHQKTKIPKKQIVEALKTSVWNKYIGADKGNAPCYVCQTTTISQREFDTGHVLAEINGGQTNLSNLRPICRKCNLSMGASNMETFIQKYFTREG